MSQKQRVVDLVFLDESKRKAVATGNNAAWRCECDRDLPLMGCSGSKKGPSAGSDCSVLAFGSVAVSLTF